MELKYDNDSKFDPLIIRNEYSNIENQNSYLNNYFKNNPNESFLLKKSYMKTPGCKSMTINQISNNIWIFENLYNNYFCFCKGYSCYFRSNYQEDQKCKYSFYLSIIDDNKYLFNKTHYLLADFLMEQYSADDAFPIFKEMIKRNISAHYMTEKKNIYKEYCSQNSQCLLVPKDININGDFLEKYIDLMLKLKAAISGSIFFSIDPLFYNIDYITLINLGHGVKYFKSFLYQDYSSARI